MSLQEKLDAFKADFERKVSPKIVSTMHQATAALIASGQAERALGASDVMPSFSLPEAGGDIVTSTGLLAHGPLVVTFFRGGWCPYCNLDLAALEAIADQIRAAGASLVAISPQTVANSRKTRREHRLSFPVLSDQGSALADRFGLRFHLPADLIAVYQSLGLDLPSVNDDPDWTLPMPARYLVDQDGVIAYAHVSPDYTRLPEPGEVLPPLQKLQQKLVA